MASAVNHVPQPLIDQLLIQVRDPRVGLSTIHELATAVLQTVPVPTPRVEEEKIKTFLTEIEKRGAVGALSEAEVEKLQKITQTVIFILSERHPSFLGQYKATTAFFGQVIERRFLDCVSVNPGHPVIQILIRSYVEKFPDQLFNVVVNHLDPGVERNELIMICFKTGRDHQAMIQKLVEYYTAQYKRKMNIFSESRINNPNFESEFVSFIQENKEHQKFIALKLAKIIPGQFLKLLSNKTLNFFWSQEDQEQLGEVLLTDNLEFGYLLNRVDHINLIVSELLEILTEKSRVLLAQKLIGALKSSPRKIIEILNNFKLNDEHQVKIINSLFRECDLSTIPHSISLLLKQIRIPGSSKFEIAKLVLEKFKNSADDFAYNVFKELNKTNPDQSYELAKLIIYYTDFFNIELLFLEDLVFTDNSELAWVSPNHLLSLDKVRALAKYVVVEKPTRMIWLDRFPLLSDEEKLELKWECVRRLPPLIEHVSMTTPGWLSEFAVATNTLSSLGREEKTSLSKLIQSIVNLLSDSDSRSPVTRLSETFRLDVLLICARHEPMIVARSPVCLGVLEKGDLQQIAELFVGSPFLKIIDRLAPLLVGEAPFHYARKCCEKDPVVINSIELFKLSQDQISTILISYIEKYDFESLKKLDLKIISELLSDEEWMKLFNFVFQKFHLDLILKSINCDTFLELSKLLHWKLILRVLNEYATIISARRSELTEALFPLGAIHTICNSADCNDDERYQLALAFARLDPEELVSIIPYFRISKHDHLLSILKTCYAIDHKSVLKMFVDSEGRQNSPGLKLIKDQDAIKKELKKLIISCSQDENNGVCGYFNHQLAEFCQFSKNEILSTLRSCAEKDGRSIAKNFDCAVRWPESPITLSAKEIVDVIEILAETAPSDFVEVVRAGYSLLTDDQKLRLTEIAFANDPRSLSSYLMRRIPKEHLPSLIAIFRQNFPDRFNSDCYQLVNPKFTPLLDERIEMAIIASRHNPKSMVNGLEQSGIPPEVIRERLLPVIARNTTKLVSLPSLVWEGCLERDKDRIVLMFMLTQSQWATSTHYPIWKKSVQRMDLLKHAAAILKDPNPRLDDFYRSCYPPIREVLSHDPNLDLSKFPEQTTDLDLSLVKELLIRYLSQEVAADAFRNFRDRSDATDHIFKATLERICHIRHGPQALKLLVALAYCLTDEGIEALKVVTQQKKKGPHQKCGDPHIPLLAPMLLVAKWVGESPSPESITLITQLNQWMNGQSGWVKEHFRKEALVPHRLAQILMKAVIALDENHDLSPIQKVRLICAGMTQATVPSSIVCLGYLPMLLESPNTIHVLQGPIGPSIKEDLEEAVFQVHLRDGSLPPVQDVKRKYFETLFPLGIRDGWKLLYNSFKEEKDKLLRGHYRTVIASVLNGTYASERDRADSPHIRRLKQWSRELWDGWVAGTPIQSLRVSSRGKSSISFPTFLREKILDGHLRDAADQELSNDLINWAKGECTAKEVLVNLKSGENNDSIKLQKKLMHMCVNPPDSPMALSDLVLELQALLRALDTEEKTAFPYFKNDLEGLSHQLDENDQEIPDCDVENIGSSFGAMLESGTVVVGSCQNLNGPPGGVQRGLMGPITDPKIRMIRVVDPINRDVRARAFLRLLWNVNKNRPILHLDRVYHSGNKNSAVVDAIHQYAQRIAREMGLEIVTADTTRGEPFTDQIRSYGGVSGLEYCDGVRGLTSGDYLISQPCNKL